jgi:hypothetical protein
MSRLLQLSDMPAITRSSPVPGSLVFDLLNPDSLGGLGGLGGSIVLLLAVNSGF